MCWINIVYDSWGNHLNDDIISKWFNIKQWNSNRWTDAFWCSILFDDGDIKTFVASSIHALNNQISSHRSHTAKKVVAILSQNRYTTSGKNELSEGQPFQFSVNGIVYSFAFNGNISNAEDIAEKKGWIEKYKLEDPILDTKILKYLMIEFLESNNWNCSLTQVIEYINEHITWACNIIIMDSDKNMATSVDKNWTRGLPYSYSANKGLFVVSSEQAPIDDVSQRIKLHQSLLEWWEIAWLEISDLWLPIFFKTIMDIKEDIRNIRCLIEFFYLMRSDSQKSYEARQLVWAALHDECQEEFDPEKTVTMSVPNSAFYATQWYSRAAGLDMVHNVLNKHDKKRTFITEIWGRKKTIESAYYVDETMIENMKEEYPDLESIVLVDDSIVNGWTMGHIPTLLKTAFKKIYGRDIKIDIRIPMAPIVDDCHSWVVMNRDKLVIVQNCEDPFNPTQEELHKIATEKFYGDSLKYLSLDRLKKTAGEFLDSDACTACMEVIDEINRQRTLKDGTRVPLEKAA